MLEQFDLSSLDTEDVIEAKAPVEAKFREYLRRLPEPITFESDKTVPINLMFPLELLRDVDSERVDYLVGILHDDKERAIIHMKNTSIILLKTGDQYRIHDGNHRISAIKRYNESADDTSKIENWTECFVIDQEPSAAVICDMVEIVCSEATLTKTEFTFPDVLRLGRLILKRKKRRIDSLKTKAAKDEYGVRMVSKKLGCKINCMKEIRRFADVSDEDFDIIFDKLKSKSMPWDKEFWKYFILKYESSHDQVMQFLRDYEHNAESREKWKSDMTKCYWEILPLFHHYGMQFVDEQDVINKLVGLENVVGINVKVKLLQFINTNRIFLDNARARNECSVDLFDAIKKQFLSWLKEDRETGEEAAPSIKSKKASYKKTDKVAAPSKKLKKSTGHKIKAQKCVLCDKKLKGHTVQLTHERLVKSGRGEMAALVEHTIWGLSNYECDCFNRKPDKDSYITTGASHPFNIEKLPRGQPVENDEDESDHDAELGGDNRAELDEQREADIRAEVKEKLQPEIRAELVKSLEPGIRRELADSLKETIKDELRKNFTLELEAIIAAKAVEEYKAQKKAKKSAKRKRKPEEEEQSTVEVMALKLNDEVDDFPPGAKRSRVKGQSAESSDDDEEETDQRLEEGMAKLGAAADEVEGEGESEDEDSVEDSDDED